MDISERTFGVEIEHGGDRVIAQRANVRAFGRRATPLGSDGSGIELRTPVLQGVQGFRDLKTCMDYLKENGQYVSQSDGMHVHLGSDDFIGNNAALANLIRSWLNLRPVFERLVSPYRWEREAREVWSMEAADLVELGQPSPSFWNGLGALVQSAQPYVHFGRCNLHLGPVLARTYGRPSDHIPNNTIEWRVHEGSIDYEVAGPWVMTIQGIQDFVVQEGQALRKMKTVKDLAEALQIDGEVLDCLKKRSRKRTESKRLPTSADIRAQRAAAAPVSAFPNAGMNDTPPQAYDILSTQARGADSGPEATRQCNCVRCINTRLSRTGGALLSANEIAAHRTGRAIVL